MSEALGGDLRSSPVGWVGVAGGASAPVLMAGEGGALGSGFSVAVGGGFRAASGGWLGGTGGTSVPALLGGECSGSRGSFAGALQQEEMFCKARMGLPDEDICMDNVGEIQTSVAGAHVLASGADWIPVGSSKVEASAMEVGEVGDESNGTLLKANTVHCPISVDAVRIVHGSPLDGQINLGSKQGNAFSSSACMHGARVNVPSKSSVLGKSGTTPGSPSIKVSQPRSAWNRPVTTPLPGREELGLASLREGRVQLDVDEVLSTVQRFDKALVGRLFGRKLNFEYLDSELHRRWNGFGNFRLVTMSGSCFICFFENLESRDAVLMGGPWIVAGQVVGVDCWSPSFSPSSHAGFVTPVWVRMPGLPLYCWGARNIARIVCQLGEPVSMDAATDRLERGQFARVCVRLDLSKPLLPGMWIDGPYGSFFQQVEYEGLSSFCFKCGHVGHKANWCGNKQAAGVPPAREEVGKQMAEDVNAQGSDALKEGMAAASGGEKMDDSGSAPIEAELHGEEVVDNPIGLGPWMLVSRKKNFSRGPADRRLKGKAEGAPVAKQKPVGGKQHVNYSSSNWEEFPIGPKVVFGWDSGKHGSGSPGTSNVKQPGLSPSQVCVANDFVQADFSGFNSISRSKAYVDRELGSLGPVTHGSRIKRRRQVILSDGGDASPVVQE